MLKTAAVLAMAAAFIPLPEDLTSFTATPISETQIRLDWTGSHQAGMKGVIVRKIGSDPLTHNDGTNIYTYDCSLNNPETYVDGGLVAGADYHYRQWIWRPASGTAGEAWSEEPVAVSATPADMTAPGSIGDLLGSDIGEHSVTLRWFDTGDDGVTGTAAAYDLRYDGSSGGVSLDFDSMAPYVVAFAPHPAGTPQTLSVQGLSASTNYAFRIRALDEAGNAGPPSAAFAFKTLAPALVPQAPVDPPTGSDGLSCHAAPASASLALGLAFAALLCRRR